MRISKDGLYGKLIRPRAERNWQGVACIEFKMTDNAWTSLLKIIPVYSP